ncbi:nucleotide-diphospho-sugar transferase [Choanephora cucurbitarum]|nr:nucleotide-diphospho-sugar transferase [Choanephora cucurbitarum]
MEGDKEINPDIWKDLPVKGALYMLVKNEQLQHVRATIRSIEDRFVRHQTANGTSSYPWILLSHQRLTPDFIKYVRMVLKDPHRIYFGHVDPEVWDYPIWISSDRAESTALKLVAAGTRDAFSQHNRKRMRYQAGFFHYHSLFDQVDYVWRMEPGTTYTCDMLPFKDDPFVTMRSEGRKLGNFIPWFINDKQVPTQCFMSTDQEWIDLSFLRSKDYTSFFQYLDMIGGFFYERKLSSSPYFRWTDGMVKSIAAAMFLQPRQIKFFNDIGTEYGPISHCPFASDVMNQCACNFEKNYNFRADSCTISLLRHIDPLFIEEMLVFAKERGLR